MKPKIFISLNIELAGGGWIYSLVDLTPINTALYAARAAIERGADRLASLVDAALGFDRMCWGMG